MKSFKPTRFDDTVNVSQEHPLKEFLSYFLKGLALLIVLYGALGFAFETYLMRMSVEQESWLLSKLSPKFALQKVLDNENEQQAYLQSLFDKIPKDLKPDGYDYAVILIDDKDPNAFAYPGGLIIVTSGLLDTLNTENELVFVLGHELGHIKNRDHLRGMGYGFAGTLISMLLSGQDHGITSISTGVYDMLNLGLSRDRERKADMVGLDVLQRVYGHAGGAAESFEQLEKMESKYLKMVPSIISSHPGHQERIKILKDYIKDHGIAEQNTVPSRYAKPQ